MRDAGSMNARLATSSFCLISAYKQSVLQENFIACFKNIYICIGEVQKQLSDEL
jgi:hypothetical protein